MKGKFIKSFDKTDIYCYTWDKVTKPVGIVQIVHGMQEHAARYDDFAKFLNKHGYIVFADDHRAHGKTAGSIENLGKYEGGNLFYDTMKDQMFFSSMLKEQYGDLPLYIFGHSYGSFITQNYIQNCDLYSKAIICGSACMKGNIGIKLGKFIAGRTIHHKGPNAVASAVEKIMQGTYKSMVKTGSWLNTDEEEVKKYAQDPYCGTPFSAKFYYDFFTGLLNSYGKHKLQEINHHKPILLISGKDDPVGSMGKSVVKLFKLYHEDDLDVAMKLYDNARHEILNEPIKEMVYQDVLDFIQKPVDKEHCKLYPKFKTKAHKAMAKKTEKAEKTAQDKPAKEAKTKATKNKKTK